MPERKRALLIGTSFSAAPLLQALRDMGFEVAVCGKDPHDACVSWADSYHAIDYSDADALAALVDRERFDFLCPSCNDFGYLAAAQVAATHGFPGFDAPHATRTLHDKAAFREFCARHSIRVPRAWTEVHAPAAIDAYPLLVKPTDSFSGRGMTLVREPAEMAAALDCARAESRSRTAVVEEFIEGTLHSHSAFLHGRRIASDYFVDEFCTVHPYQVNCSNAPSLMDDAVREQMRGHVERLGELLQLGDGLLHTQFLVRDGIAYVIECMRRCPGDLFYHLVSYLSGASYIEDYLRPFVGDTRVPVQGRGSEPWARHTVSLPRPAIVWSIEPRLACEQLQVFGLSPSGARIGPAPFDKAAIVFARLDGMAALRDVTPRLAELIHVHQEAQAHDSLR